VVGKSEGAGVGTIDGIKLGEGLGIDDGLILGSFVGEPVPGHDIQLNVISEEEDDPCNPAL